MLDYLHGMHAITDSLVWACQFTADFECRAATVLHKKLTKVIVQPRIFKQLPEMKKQHSKIHTALTSLWQIQNFI